jgi:hypothetical protein
MRGGRARSREADEDDEASSTPVNVYVPQVETKTMPFFDINGQKTIIRHPCNARVQAWFVFLEIGGLLWFVMRGATSSSCFF